MNRSRLLHGHGLRAELRVLPACPLCQDPPAPSNYRSQPGHAECACGALSEHASTFRERRTWHNQHKDEVRAQLVAAWMHSSYESADAPGEPAPIRLVRTAGGRLVHRSDCALLRTVHDSAVQEWTWARDRSMEEVRRAMPMTGAVPCQICQPLTSR